MTRRSQPVAPSALVLATNNRHKVEDKPTIEGNALKKAREVAKRTGLPALADDTGLFVRGLRGAPGVYSARYAGPGCTFQDNNQKVLRGLKGLAGAKRAAAFRCIAALARPDGKAVFVEGRISGQISEKLSGGKGFGYDPVFLVPSLGKTFAQLSSAKKNEISHRGRAFRQVPGLWRRLYGRATAG